MSNLTELNPLIYPTRIWVGLNLSDKDIADEFWGLSDNRCDKGQLHHDSKTHTHRT